MVLNGLGFRIFFAKSVKRFFRSTSVRRYDAATMLRRYDGTTVRRYNSTTLRRYDGTMVRRNLDHLPTFNQSQDSRPVMIFCCIVHSGHDSAWHFWSKFSCSGRRVCGHGDIENWSPTSFKGHFYPISTRGRADYANPILMSPPSFESHRRTCTLIHRCWICLNNNFFEWLGKDWWPVAFTALMMDANPMSSNLVSIMSTEPEVFKKVFILQSFTLASVILI